MLFKLSNLNSNLAVTLGYFNPALNKSFQKYFRCSQLSEIPFTRVRTNFFTCATRLHGTVQSPRVPSKRKVDPCKFLTVQIFFWIRINGL